MAKDFKASIQVENPQYSTKGNSLENILASKYNFNIKICKISKSTKI